MRGPARAGWLALALALSACAGPSARIRRHRQAFDSYPPPIQQAIREGRVELGMTPQMVELAAGAPDQKLESQSAAGTIETWLYWAQRSRVGVGFGIGSWGPHVGSSVGVGVGGPGEPVERLRVSFQDGRVVSVSQAK